ncbi:solute:sodium symporter family transporter [Halalkalibacter alkaliphilus]|uniref:Solute:sodium symporter family transporter n=1 Tax=Halalkalibacter alkaliphilus TaxID=2917993 RepID=A0A9X1ZWY5_9BACI|nr:solute:sodium symporter family transporter [Halalkalibacter alkaliphilus]MCL7746208.1 solute:sodium symporter family transporter [Halalkalibacter alkaliphilus]
MIWVIFTTFMIYTIFVMWFSWYKTKGTDLSSQDGYFLGGRSLPGLVIACSIILTNLSTEQIVGLNGQAFGESMVVMAWEVSSPIALIIMAFVFLPRYLKTGITTIPDFLEQRYDLRTRQIVSVLFIVGYAVAYLPTVLYSGALVLDSIFSITTITSMSPFMIVLLISVAIGLVGCGYVILGGLKATAMSDTINGIGLIAGGLLIPILGLIALGGGNLQEGVNHLLTANPTKLNAIGDHNASVPWAVLLTGMLFNNLFYWATNQSIIQRSLGAKNLAEGQKGVLFAGMFKVFGVTFLALPGIIAFFMYGNTLANPDLAYPTLVGDVMPLALSGILAAILFGAIMSSFNNALNASITLFTLDIYKPIFKPQAKDKELVKAGRFFAAGLAAISVIVAPFIIFAPQGLYAYLQEMFGFYSMPILAMVLVGFFSKRIPALAPKVAVVVHVILYAASKVVLADINFLYVLSVLFPLNVLTMVIVGRLRPRETPFVLHDANVVDLKPWKYAKPFSIFMIVVMLSVYTFFSPVGVAEVSVPYSPWLFVFLFAVLGLIAGIIWYWVKMEKRYTCYKTDESKKVSSF